MRREKGFSMVELLVVTAVLITLTASVFSLIYRSQKQFAGEEDTREAIQNVRLLADIIARMLKELGADPNKSANSGLIGPLESNRLRFTADLTGDGGKGDPDGRADDPYENVTIAFESSEKTVYLGLGASAPQPLAKDIKNLKFEYYKLDETTGAETATSDPAEVRKVRIIVEIEPEHRNLELYRREGFRMVSSSNASVAYGVDVQLRNRKAFNPFSD